jgi:hypothetical protein
VTPPTDTVDVDGADAVPTAPPVDRVGVRRAAVHKRDETINRLTQDLIFGNEPEAAPRPTASQSRQAGAAIASDRPGRAQTVD